MAPITILLAHPGASFSTHDVYTGMLAGLEAHGCRVISYRLDEALGFYQNLFEAAEQGGLQWGTANGERPNVAGFAGLKGIAELINVAPDYLVSVSGYNLHPSVVMMARKMGITTAVYCTESPYFGVFEAQIAAHYDAICTMERRALPLFEQVAPGRTHYLPHAYNPAVHYPGAAEPDYAADVFFVGSAFDERRRLFRAVDWSGVNFVTRGFLWGENADPNVIQLDELLDNADAARYYRSSAISLNHHRTTTVYGTGEYISGLDAESLGPRAYEISACGGFQLMDDSREERHAVFQGTVPTYKSHSALDLERQVRYYLTRPDERARLAQAQREAVAPHSWHARAAQLLDILTATPRPVGVFQRLEVA